MSTGPAIATDRVTGPVGSARASTWRRTLRYSRTRVGFALSLPVLLIAVVGPLLAPHSPTALIGAPYESMSKDAWLGTDYIGRDVLSRVLSGGISVLSMSLAAASVGALVGITLGLVAGNHRGWLDEVIMRSLDVLLAFPHLVLILLFVALIGPNPWLITMLVAVFFVPGIARITRGLTQDACSREYVQAAEIIGAPRWRILVREILPNLTTPLSVEVSLRLTWAVMILASLSFLGFGVQQPRADWGLMANENRDGMDLQPWAILAPILCIALLTVGVSLIAEGFARTMAGVDRQGGRS